MHCNQDKVGVQQPGLQFTLNGFINVLMLSVPPDLMTFQIDDSESLEVERIQITLAISDLLQRARTLWQVCYNLTAVLHVLAVSFRSLAVIHYSSCTDTLIKLCGNHVKQITELFRPPFNTLLDVLEFICTKAKIIKRHFLFRGLGEHLLLFTLKTVNVQYGSDKKCQSGDLLLQPV